MCRELETVILLSSHLFNENTNFNSYEPVAINPLYSDGFSHCPLCTLIRVTGRVIYMKNRGTGIEKCPSGNTGYLEGF